MDAKAAKARENRSRHFAKRRGWTLAKSWTKTPTAPDYDVWTLTAEDGVVLFRVKGIESVEAELDKIVRSELSAA